MFIFKKKKSKELIKNEYDIILSTMLDELFSRSIMDDLKYYAKIVYIRQKSLPVYPEGEEYDAALNRLKSNQKCLQYSIEEYDEWYARVTNYIEENMYKFDYYHGYQTGDRVYPLMSYEIIDNVVLRLK